MFPLVDNSEFEIQEGMNPPNDIVSLIITTLYHAIQHY